MTDRHETRATTHADDCWSWGPAHYECAMREVEALRAEVDEWKALAKCASEQQDSLFREARALNERADKLAEELIEMNDHIEELKKRGMITSLAKVPDARTDSPARAAKGEEIMVSVGCDVYTLPLHPTGLLSGPRFVVHVPQPTAKPCTCHPDDNPPNPCPRKYALDECRKAALPAHANGAANVVAWARPVYARPAYSTEPWEDETVDVEFHLRAERPKGEGWRPLVFAAPLPARPNATP